MASTVEFKYLKIGDVFWFSKDDGSKGDFAFYKLDEYTAAPIFQTSIAYQSIDPDIPIIAEETEDLPFKDLKIGDCWRVKWCKGFSFCQKVSHTTGAGLPHKTDEFVVDKNKVVTRVIKDEDADQMKSGTKHDANKLRYDLVPATLEREIAKVMTFGAGKYGDLNWTNGIGLNRLYAAMRRHLDAWWSGEDTDPESGICHLAHLAANAGMALVLQQNEANDNRTKYCK